MKEFLYLKDDQLKEFIEKISMSYRETFSDAKKVLNKYSIGVAHHKVINLISLYNGITISELLKKLKITKQSLNRVLKDLINIGVVDFKRGKKDTRLKHVYLNDKGTKLFNEVFDIQKKRIYNALLTSSAKEVINFNKVLNKIINEKI
jgi:DNA-binding MarR family transcriptional regulator|tara:strand:- start:49 stop:492 length:444 start_codon:yes stop_codon:yes gene_type:complete